MLQAAERSGEGRSPGLATASRATTARPRILVAAADLPITILAAMAPRPITLTLAGHPLMLTNASGSPAGADPLRARLLQLGWSAPASAVKPGPRQADSQIVFAPQVRPVPPPLARPLARKRR